MIGPPNLGLIISCNCLREFVQKGCQISMSLSKMSKKFSQGRYVLLLTSKIDLQYLSSTKHSFLRMLSATMIPLS